jgi:hypothetical protein
MLKVLMIMVALFRSRVHLRPGDFKVARIAIFTVFSLHALEFCELSEKFCSDLCDFFRRRPSQDLSIGETNPAESPSPVWLALGIYYRAMTRLIRFKPSSPISEIFDDLQSHAERIAPKFRRLLLDAPLYLGSNRPALENSLDETLRRFIPEVPELTCFDVACWTGSEDQFPVPTALSRQRNPFDQQHYSVKCIFYEDPASGMVPQDLFGPQSVPCWLLGDHPKTTTLDPYTTQGRTGEQTPTLSRGIGYYSLPSSDEQTADETIFSELTNIDTLYSEISSLAFSPS